jgi:hypothetical protein
MLEGLVVRGTLPPPGTERPGAGVVLQFPIGGFPSEPDFRTAGRLQRCLVEQNETAGIAALEAKVVVEGTVVRDTRPDEQGSGHGMMFRTFGVYADEDPELTRATLRNLVVEQSYAAGIIFWGVAATVERSVVRDTLAVADSGPEEHWPGDAVVVLGRPELPRRVELSRTLIQRSARAGVANFGSTTALQRISLDCNLIHLNGEQAYEVVGFPVVQEYSFDDHGGNSCGCGGELEACQVLSSGLSPPEPFDPLE